MSRSPAVQMIALKAAVVALGIIAAPHPVRAALDLIQNGSFELGTNRPGGDFATLTATNTDIANWTVTNGSVDWIGTYWMASDQNYSLDMNGLNAGTIQQTGIATTIGQTYEVTFDISGNPAGGPDPKNLDVIATIGGASSYSYSIVAHGNTLSNMDWVTESFFFTAGSALTTLSFQSTTTDPSGNESYPSAFGPALDNVHMYAVPEASTFAIWSLLGVVLTVRAGRRR